MQTIAIFHQYIILYYIIWFVLSFILNLASIATLVDGLVVWKNFFRSILDVYEIFVKHPFMDAAISIMPTFIPRPPEWAFNLFVLWGVSAAGYRFCLIFDREYSVFKGKLDFFLTLLAGPVTIIALIFGIIYSFKLAETEHKEDLLLDFSLHIKNTYPDITKDQIYDQINELIGSKRWKEIIDGYAKKLRKRLLRTVSLMLLPYLMILFFMMLNFQMVSR